MERLYEKFHDITSWEEKKMGIKLAIRR
jgi:hypothetical protein